MLLRRAFLAPILCLALALGLQAPARAELTCGDIPDLTTYFFQKHIKFHQLSDELMRRTSETYLRRMDPQRALFLEEDAQRWQGSLQRVFRESGGGDCSRLQDFREDLVSRNLEAEGFIRGFVGREDYQLDETAELVIDPEKRGYPTSKEERDALLRTLAHFQISNYVSSGAELKEARERLIHRYELRTKRASELTRADLYSSFLDSFANSLDPHSAYFSADVLEDFQIQMQLSLEGIGVALSERDGYAVVEQIIPGGAADRLDVLRPEDRIIAVAEEGKEPVDVIDMALRDVVRLIRGKKGTRVHLSVIRQAEKTERFQVAIVRDKIDLEQQAASLRIEEVEVDGRTLKLAVVDLPSFYGDRDPSKRQGSKDVRRLLEQAKLEGAEGLVLDVSRNGGGLLEDAVTLTGFFINEGAVVAVKEGEDRRRLHDDPGKGVVWSGPMVVLTTRITASASEILAGAMQDYARAVVVGDGHTFGKGTVQSVFPLRTGLGALKVTTGVFFRPGGHSTQHSGVASDVRVPSLFAQDTFGEANQPNSLPPQAIAPFMGRKANGRRASKFTPVSEETLEELAHRSAERVAEDRFFIKVEEQLAERAADSGVVSLADLLARQDEDRSSDTASTQPAGPGSPGSETASAGSPESGSPEKEEPGPALQEALRILGDLVVLQK